MPEFMEKDFGEFGVGLKKEGVQDGVSEPAEGGVSAGGAVVDVIIAALFQPFAIGARAGEGEIATIIEAADDGIPPGFGLERKFRGGLDVPDDELTFEVDVVLVVAIEVEGEVGAGEAAELLDEEEAVAEDLGGMGVGEQIRDGLALGKELVLAFNGLGVEGERAAAGDREPESEQEQNEDGSMEPTRG